MEQMGIPPEIAKQALAAGFTSKNVEAFIKQMGKMSADQQMEQLEGPNGPA